MPLFAANMVYIISPTAYQKNGVDGIRWNMAGTGPFTQTNFQRDVSLTTVRNPDYWAQGKPYLDGVQYLFVADELTRIALYKSGGADVLNCNGSGRVASDLQAAGYKIVSQTSGTSVLWPDTGNPDSPWSSPKVRQAAEFAIDKAAIAKTFGYGFSQPAYQLPIPASPAYIPNLTNRTYNVAKAKQLLTEAGFPNGFKTTIVAPNSVNQNIIIAIQANLAAVGIQCSLNFVEASAFATYTSGTWNNALVYDSNEAASPNFNQMLGHNFSLPRAGYKSNKLPDNWLDLYNATMNAPEAQTSLEQACVQALYDDVSIIPVNYQSDIWAVNNKLQDTGMGTRGNSVYWNPENTWLSK